MLYAQTSCFLPNRESQATTTTSKDVIVHNTLSAAFNELKANAAHFQAAFALICNTETTLNYPLESILMP
jgi:hypothetical protein